jgi:Na+-driven multidrug efflux pump
MRKFVANAAYLAASFAVVLTVATGLLCRRILMVMNTPEDIFAQSYSYIFVIFMGISTTFLYNLLAGIIRAMGDSKTPVYFLALSSFLNIFLDLVLILYCNVGVMGAAIATVVSQGVSGVACLIFMTKKYPVLRMTREERQFDPRSCQVLCSMGIPMGLQYSITAIGSIVLQSSVNMLGSASVAAVAAGVKLIQLLSCPFDAMGATMATYCGQNVGACKLDRLGQGIRSCSLLGLGYSLLAIGGMLLCANQCAMLFLDPQEPNLAQLMALTREYVLICTAFFFPLALVNIVRFSIQGMGFSTFAILAGVLEMAARTVVGHYFVPMFGYVAACFASPAAWICADLFLVPASAWCISRLRKLYPSQPEKETQGSTVAVPAGAGR